MYRENIDLTLKPSLLRLVFSISVVWLWGYFASQVLSTFWVIFTILMIAVSYYIAYKKAWWKVVKALSQLDGREWSLQTQQQLERIEIATLQDYGVFISIHAIEQQSRKPMQFCILKDQVSKDEWRMLKTMASTHTF
ncbi:MULTISPECIES: protein YgfX [unclassified Acinetobacter]|uniref:protein YgfX n=1 Tax=unclassified Acinetobacter TaxID=196816 RepID=UPI0035BB6FCA